MTREEECQPTARWRHLPTRIRIEDTIESSAAKGRPAEIPTSTGDPDRDWMLLYIPG